MVFVAASFMLGFAISVILYGVSLNKIRSHLKENHLEQFNKLSLDAVSMFLGTDDVEWNFQKFVHKRKYLELNDQQLNELCERTRKYGLVVFGCGISMLTLLVLNGIVGS